MDLMNLLQGQLNNGLLQQLSQHIGADEKQTESAAQGIFAALIGGLANNASSPSGLSSLSSALDKNHDGSILDDIMGLVSGTSQQNNPAANGIGILGHILGAQQSQVAQQISTKSGLNMTQIMKLMPILAPIVMGLIGKLRNANSLPSTNQEQGSTGGGIFDLAKILMGSAQSAQGGGFGDLIGSVLGGVLSGNTSNQQGASEPVSTQNESTGIFGKILGSIFKGGQ